MIYNKLGVFQVLISAIIGGAIMFVFSRFYPNSPLATQIFFITGGASLLIIDWQHRYKAKEYARYGYQKTFFRFLGPTDGGNLMFIPTWLIGIASIFRGIVGDI